MGKNITQLWANVAICILLAAVVMSTLVNAKSEVPAVRYRVMLESMPMTFDPVKPNETASIAVLLQVFDTLFARDQSGQTKPLLVESYVINPDRDRYVFTLRRNALFHDGTPVTSDDVKYSLSRKIGQYAGSLAIIKGSVTYEKGQAKEVEGIRVLDSKRFEIVLNNPYAELTELLTETNLSIVPQHFLASQAKGQIVGSGSYTLASTTKNTVILKAFDRHHSGLPDITEIEYRVVGSEQEAKALIAKAELDNTHPFDIQIPDPKQWREYASIDTTIRFLMLNQTDPRLKDKRVRQALYSVLPISELHDQLRGDARHPVSHFVPLGLPGYLPEQWNPPLTTATAQGVLKTLKWKTPLVLTNYLPDQAYRDMAEKICIIWQSNQVNCQVSTVPLDGAVELINQNKHQALMGKFVADIPETGQLLSFFRSDHTLTVFNLNDTKIDEMLNKAMQQSSLHIRADYYRVINRMIYEHYAVVPLSYGGWQKRYIRKPFVMPELDITGPYLLRIRNIKLAAD